MFQLWHVNIKELGDGLFLYKHILRHDSEDCVLVDYRSIRC